MMHQSKNARSPHRINQPTNGKRPLSELRRRPSRITARTDNDMLGSASQHRTKLNSEDETWLRSALQSRLPLF